MKKKRPINHLNIQNEKLTSYDLAFIKVERSSWLDNKNKNNFIDKKKLINWLKISKDFPEDLFNMIFIDGILNGELKNFSYIFKISMHEFFLNKESKDIYFLLYEIIDNVPLDVLIHIDEEDYHMIVDVFKLLVKSVNE